jgi:hypothetical protein
MTSLEILLLRGNCYTEDQHIRDLLSLAEGLIGPDYTNRPLAVALLSLHWLALEKRGKGSAGGNITSETEGGLSRSYAVPVASMDSSFLASTSWGAELLNLRRGSFPAFMNRRNGAF